MAQLSQKQTLSVWEVNPEDIVMDYHDAMSRYSHYAEIAWRVNAGMPPGAVARDMGFAPGSMEYTRIAKDVPLWRREERLPRGVRAIMRLHLDGVFPGLSDYEYSPDGENIFDVNMIDAFDCNNPKFRALSFLASMQYWTGSLSQQTQVDRENTTKVSRIDKGDIETMQDVVLELIEALDCDFSNYPTHIQLASYVSRVINQLGLPLGQRSKADISIPEHIKAALNTLDGECSREHTYIALNAIQDFILIFLSTRCRDWPKRRGYTGFLFKPDPEIKEEQIRIFKEVMEVGYMGMPVTVKPYKSATRVILPGMTDDLMSRMQNELRGRISSMTNALN
ncbi:MAG: hypothetical protein O3B47_03050 [bacterium]|nr:hypothetical protein [bacterium]